MENFLKERYVIRNLNEIKAVRCPCGMSKRAFTEMEEGKATLHLVDIFEDARLHYHKEHAEMYYILEGDGHMELDGKIMPVHPGTAIYIQPYCRHRALGKMKIVNVSLPAFAPDDEWFD
ncbi:MAG: cupin domain-containing protein [Lentisphaeria bacterium]|nr:cupin domain-containing protein [Lentisphaeria bacterium]